jgi:CheY-like chemotaxis protein
VIGPAKILAVDDEPDFELFIRQRFRRQIRELEFTFRFAHHGEETLAALAGEPDINLVRIRFPPARSHARTRINGRLRLEVNLHRCRRIIPPSGSVAAEFSGMVTSLVGH